MLATARGKNGGIGPGKNRITEAAGDSPRRRGPKGSAKGGQSTRSRSGGPVSCAADVELTVQRWEDARSRAKELYEAADQLEQELIGAIGIGGSLTLSDNRTVRVVDNFRDAAGNPKVKHFGLAGVKLAEIKVK